MMAYRIPKSEARKPENQFEFESPDGKHTYRVPFLQYLPPKLMLEVGDTSDESKLVQALNEILKYYSTDEMDLVSIFEDGGQMIAWMNAWQEASTVSMGESPASEDSSKSTEAH